MNKANSIAFAYVLISLGTAYAQNAALPLHPSWSELNPVTHFTPQTFEYPQMNDRVWVRMNTPETLSSEELQAEIADMKARGIGGVEVGQGTFPATPQLVAILKAANQQGLKVSLSHGTTVAPKGYSFDEDNARKTLLFTSFRVGAGQTGDLKLVAPLPPKVRGFGPESQATPAPRRSSLLEVLAYKCAESSCEHETPVVLDSSSVRNLTAQLTEAVGGGVMGTPTAARLRWTAPDAGEWLVIAFWSQAAYAQPDLFSIEGTDELIHGMEADWTPEVKALLKQNGGCLFYDSHSSDRGSPTELWTNNMEAEFRARRGYSLLANAAALFPEDFTFSDGTAPRVRNDLNAVRSDLWVEKHLMPLKTWAHSYNLRLRLQPYGEVVAATPDEIQAASVLDRPETESLYFGDEIDSYLPIASANHMTGNTWFSTECCAVLGKAYAETFQDAVIRMNREYAAGVTRLVYHVYPYRDAPNSKWPGYHSFGSAGFSNAWGPRNPFWIDAKVYNDYFARTQQVLMQGVAKVDVAIYMLSYTYPQPMQVKGGFHIWSDTSLQEAGYTRDYLDPTLLNLPEAKVDQGRLAMDRAAYKVLILDREQQPSTNPERDAIPLETAQRVLVFGKAGLPIVLVGSAPDRVPGRELQNDGRVRELMAELLLLPNVHQVRHESDVAALLRSLKIYPSMEPENPSPLISLHRVDDARGLDIYFLYNQTSITPAGEPANLFEPEGTKSFDGTITLQGQGSPYLLDAWSGAISPIRDFARVQGGIKLRLHLAADDAAIVALSRTSIANSAVSTQSLTPIPSNSKVIDLTMRKWNLSVQEWSPEAPYGTTGVDATKTAIKTSHFELNELKPWLGIPGLQDASGIGVYTTTVDLPNDPELLHNVILQLGEVMDSFQLSINDRLVPINQISATARVGRYLKPGKNTIQVRVATTLNNRLAAIDSGVRKRNYTQSYGLIGPVLLDMPR
jgi:hypothetical protein